MVEELNPEPIATENTHNKGDLSDLNKWVKESKSEVVAKLIYSLQLENDRLDSEKKNLLETSHTDPRTGVLSETGLINHVNQLEAILAEESIPEERREKPHAVSVIVADVNFLHDTNRIFSMLAGDRYLTDVGDAFQHSTKRRSDLIAIVRGEKNVNKHDSATARLGGQADEFVMILPGTNADDVHVVLDKVRLKLSELNKAAQEQFPGIKYGISTVATTCNPGEILDAVSESRNKIDEAKTIRKRGEGFGDVQYDFHKDR